MSYTDSDSDFLLIYEELRGTGVDLIALCMGVITMILALGCSRIVGTYSF